MADISNHIPPDLEARIDLLEQMVAEAKAVPLSASIMLNRAEMDALVADLRDSLPEEIRRARWVIKERDDILLRAEEDARQMIEDAKVERDRLVSKTEVVEAANREAERVLDHSREHARQLRLEAEDYVDAKLARFEVVLQKTLQAVDRGRQKLGGRIDAEALADDDFDEDA